MKDFKVTLTILFVAHPVNHLYPQDIWEGNTVGQKVHLLQAKPKVCGVVWGKVSKALPVWDPVSVEVHQSILSLRTLEYSVNWTFSVIYSSLYYNKLCHFINNLSKLHNISIVE